MTNDLSARLVDDLDGAFTELVATYEKALFSTAYRLSGDAERARDLTAESLLRAYGALRRYDAQRLCAIELRPWLITILLNVWRNDVRTAARRPYGISIDDLPEIASNLESTEHTAERHLDLDQLAAVLLCLSERQRVGVVLRHVVGLSYEELADIWSCPVNTAKSHVHHGLAQLRTLITTKEIDLDGYNRG